MSTPLLPKLKKDVQIALGECGKWQHNSQTVLGNLVNSLQVETDKKTDITSIPDLWARPVLYEMVLFSKNHPLRAKYVAEWRGILTMLALRDLRGFSKLSLESLDLSDRSNTLEFYKLIKNFLPSDFQNDIYEDATVTGGLKLQILTCSADKANPFPIALIWPSILVCPAVDLDKKKYDKVNWWFYDGLSDPIPSLSDDEKAFLTKWLKQLKVKYREKINQFVADHPGSSVTCESAKVTKLFTLLDEFVEAINVEEQAYDEGNGLGITGFCNILDTPIKDKVDSDFINKSDIRLIDQEKCGAPTLLVMTNDIEQDYNRNKNKIVVAGSSTVDSVIPQYTGFLEERTKLNGKDLRPFNAELRLGTDFLTDKIALVDSKESIFPNALQNLFVEYNGARHIYNVIMPIKAELLKYLKPDYIANNIQVRRINEGIEVTLTLPLADAENKEHNVKVKKVYYDNQIDSSMKEIVIYNERPLIQVWPNFVTERPQNWQAYYSFYDTSSRRIFYARPAWEDAASVELDVEDQTIEIVKGNTFPNKFICYERIKRASGWEKNEIGLVLLKPPVTIKNKHNNKPIKIGIDFGTTNTVAYMGIPNEAPKLIHFENRLYNVTVPESEEDLRRYFIPAAEQPNGAITSIRTVFHQQPANVIGTDNKIPLFFGNIYYFDSAENVTEDANISSELKTNLKWDNADDNSGYRRTNSFLAQIGLQALAEAVVNGASSVDFVYSYPTAFTPSKINSMADLWRNLVEDFHKVCDLVATETPTKATESVAMAEFFADKNSMSATIYSGITCFDIGGGTTDIAFWHGSKNEKVFQTSVMLAGRDILNHYIYEHRDKLVSPLFSGIFAMNDKLADFAKKLQIAGQEEFYMHLEALLKYHEQDIMRELAAQSTIGEVKILIRNIAFALAGLFFYSGYILGYLKHENKYNSEDLPDCYIGGNGSKLLDWISRGHFTEDNGINNVLKFCFMRGVETSCPDIEFEEEMKVCRSSKPKQEVAYGLVCDGNVLKDNSKQTAAEGGVMRRNRRSNQAVLGDNSIVVAEKFLIAGNEPEEEQRFVLSKYEFLKGIQITRDLPSLRNFLDEFNNAMEALGYPTIILSDKDITEIRKKVNQELSDKINAANGNEKNLVAEPIFIMALREAMARL